MRIVFKPGCEMHREQIALLLVDRDGVCHVASALAGTTFLIGRCSGEPIVMEDWCDGGWA